MSSPNQKPGQGDPAKDGGQQSIGFEKDRSVAVIVIIVVLCAAAYVLSKLI